MTSCSRYAARSYTKSLSVHPATLATFMRSSISDTSLEVDADDGRAGDVHEVVDLLEQPNGSEAFGLVVRVLRGERDREHL